MSSSKMQVNTSQLNQDFLPNPTKPSYSSAPLLVRLIAVLFWFGTIAVNVVIGNFVATHSVIQVSDKYKLFVTPPPFTFGIWGLIWLLMTALVLYASCKNLWSTHNYVLFCLTCIVNSVWVGIWTQGTDTAMVICLFINLIQPITLFSLWVRLYHDKDESLGYYFQRNSVALYFGWAIAAFTLSFGVVLVYVLGMTQKEFLIIFWILAPALTLGMTVLSTVMQGINGFKSLLGMWVAVLWGAAGAIVSTLDNRQYL